MNRCILRVYSFYAMSFCSYMFFFICIYVHVCTSTWTEVPSSEVWFDYGDWSSITSSADGTKLAAVMWSHDDFFEGDIWVSSNSGATWQKVGWPVTRRNWESISSSADGTKMAAVEGGDFDHWGTQLGGNIWSSFDSGATWSEMNSTGSANFLEKHHIFCRRGKVGCS